MVDNVGYYDRSSRTVLISHPQLVDDVAATFDLDRADLNVVRPSFCLHEPPINVSCDSELPPKGW